jgi:transcriptional regulator with XRE-family HTH domain
MAYILVMRYDTKQITKRRMQKGWSKNRLARAVDLDPKTITNLEAGRGGKPETIAKVANILGLRIDRLVIDNDTAA